MIKETGATPLTLLSSAEVWDRIDPLAPDLGTDPVVMGLGALPYAQLSCPQFERLCYELLVAEGFSPRFFGRRGQRDYGVDIIVESGEKRRVYQCKNFAHEPKSAELRDAVAKFEADWLIGANLPRPQQFVYCCPQPLNDKALGESWTKFKDDFQQRTKVEVSFWDKYALDARLRRLPDIVAGLFSDSYAEHFCMCDDWRDDLWIRVSWNEARHPSIERFLNWHKRGAIYVSDEDEQHFQDLLSASPVLAIRGLPGSGKTFFGLEMGCRLYEPRRRLYYATLKDSTNPDRLWKSVRRRGNLPSLFVLDDCHLDLNCAGIVRERLVPELKGGAVKLLFILRDPPVSAIHEFDDTPDWLISLEQDEALIDMRTSLNRTRTVVEHLRTDMVGLSQLRLGKLHHFSGGDLLLLDELLSGIHSPLELDELRPEKLYHQIRSRYFEGNRILPTIRILASLAQFDLTPLASFLDGGWQSGEKALAAPLMSELFGPPRYQFLHSSLAELVLRAQAALEIDTAHLEQDVAKTTAGALLTYLHHLLLSSAARDGREVVFMANLELVLTGRLKLAEGSVEAGIKASVLADEAIQAGVEAHLNHCSFNFLNICLINLSIAAHPALRRYLELVENRFRLLFQHHHDGFDSIGLKTVGTGFLSLRRNAPDVLARMEEEFGSENLLCLIVANGNLFELFRILQYATSAFREALMDRLDPGRATALVEKTITARRSVGTLHFTIRELSKTDPALLGRLEQAIGAQQFLRLIAANGTLFELFRIMEYATPAFREALMDRLDPDGAAALVDKTIAAGRSVGTLPLTMRELSETAPALLGRLEQAIGAQQFLRLIAANGTLFELFRIMEYATPAFREALMDRLDPAEAAALVDKTIAARRSVGTLHLTMRELSETAPVLLGRLEQAIGAQQFLRLIAANGTLFELFRIMEYATPAFREALMDRLDPDGAAALVDKTIAAGRSVGTLPLAMRELSETDPALLGRLEQAIGAQQFLRLIAANGTLIDLFGILERATSAFRKALVDRLDPDGATVLVDKTIAAGRSIESLHHTLRQLSKIPAQLERLEDLIGVHGWWRLFVGVGTLNSISQNTQVMSDVFRERIINASSDLGVPEWQGIIARGLFLNACTFVTDKLATYPAASRTAFCEALRQAAGPLAAEASWFDINPSHPPASPDSDESRILHEALRMRVEGINMDGFFGLDFREATNALAFAWRKRIDLRPSLASHFLEILPPTTEWPRQEGVIAAIRLVLAIARSEAIPLQDAQQLLATTGLFLDQDVCAETHTLPLFLLIWNMVALHYERVTNHSFDGALPNKLVETLLDQLEQRVRSKGPNKEKIAQLALAGLLGFLLPSVTAKLRNIIKPFSGTTPWLEEEINKDQVGFVPALFALEGIALLKQSDAVFKPLVCAKILLKLGKYEDIGPAIEHLRERVKRHGKRR